MIPDTPEPRHRLASVEAGGSILLYGLDGLLLAAGGVLLARAFGPQGKGAITLMVALMQRTTLLLTLGVEVALVHFGGRRTLPARQLPSIALRAGALLGIANAVIAGTVLWTVFRDDVGSYGLRWATPLLVVLPLASVSAFVVPLVQLKGRLLEANAILAVGGLLGTAGAAAAFFAHFSLGTYLVILAFASLVEYGCTVLLGFRSGALSQREPPDRDTVRKVVGYGLRSHVGTVFQGVNDRFDVFVIALIVSVAAVGVYSVAVAAAEVLSFIPIAVGLVLLHRGSIQSKDEVARVVAVGSRLTLLIMVAGAVVLGVAGSRLIPFVFGAAFARGATTLRLLLPGVCALGLWRVIVQGLAGWGHPEAKSVSAGAAAVLTVALDLALTPRWGINGAAVASTVAYSGAFAVAAVYAARVLGIGLVDLVVPRARDVSAVIGEVRTQLASRRAG